MNYGIHAVTDLPGRFKPFSRRHLRQHTCFGTSILSHDLSGQADNLIMHSKRLTVDGSRATEGLCGDESSSSTLDRASTSTLPAEKNQQERAGRFVAMDRHQPVRSRYTPTQRDTRLDTTVVYAVIQTRQGHLPRGPDQTPGKSVIC